MSDELAIGIVEDHPVFRQGLAGLVEDAPGLVLSFAVRSIAELDVELSGRERPPALLLLDLSLKGGGPQRADAVSHACGHGLRVLVVSHFDDRPTVVAAMAAGAKGYISKHAEPQEIVRAMRTVADGGSYISPTLAGLLLDNPHWVKLTPREIEVLRLVAGGEKDLDIAAELFISVHGVHRHLERIRAKTGHHNRVGLANEARERGLVPPPGSTDP